jgi:DNA ligase-associated metallophosphoesterase
VCFEPGAIEVAGAALATDAAGALVIEGERMVVVADLHLEKGSAFARKQVFLPPYDTATTLLFLSRVIARWAPRVVVALGDSFHDSGGVARMAPRDRETLAGLQKGRDWIWVAGNHDAALPADLGGEICDELRLGPLTLRHEPKQGAAPGEIAGHLHPVARVVSESGSARRRCFVADSARCILPAFGAYAGGLNILDPAIAALFPCGASLAHVLGRGRVFRVPLSSCAAEPRRERTARR